MGQHSFQGNAVFVAISLAGICFRLSGDVQGNERIQRHSRLGEGITETPFAEHCWRQMSCIRGLDSFHPSVIANVADSGHDNSLEYRPLQMGRQLSTVRPGAPPHGCGAIHCVHSHPRYVLLLNSYYHVHCIPTVINHSGNARDDVCACKVVLGCYNYTFI